MKNKKERSHKIITRGRQSTETYKLEKITGMFQIIQNNEWTRQINKGNKNITKALLHPNKSIGHLVHYKVFLDFAKAVRGAESSCLIRDNI